MHGDPQEHVTYELVLASPAVPCVSCLPLTRHKVSNVDIKLIKVTETPYIDRYLLPSDIAQVYLLSRQERKKIKLMHVHMYMVRNRPWQKSQLADTITFIILRTLVFLWLWIRCYIPMHTIYGNWESHRFYQGTFVINGKLRFDIYLTKTFFYKIGQIFKNGLQVFYFIFYICISYIDKLDLLDKLNCWQYKCSHSTNI